MLIDMPHSAYRSCVCGEKSYESSFAIGLAAANSRLMVSQRNAQGEEKLEAAVGTTYRWNTAVALPHTAPRFSSTDAILMVFVKGVHGVLQWGQILGAYPH